jgi:RecA-family ATPase
MADLTVITPPTLDQYLSLPRDHNMWVIKPWLPIGGKCLIYSSAKTGKSSLAMQLAHAVSGNAAEWMGFPVVTHGRVIYIQIDTPRSTWAGRIDTMRTNGFVFNNPNLAIVDTEFLGEELKCFPPDILQPVNVEKFGQLIHAYAPVDLVIIDTLRKFHSGDENSSTAMTAVMNNIKKVCYPAAIVLISHDSKPQPDVDREVISGHRGSTAVVAEMDGIIQLSKTRLKYAGRSIEQGAVKVRPKVLYGEQVNTIMWEADPNEHAAEIQKVLADTSILSLREHGRALSELTGKHEDQAVSSLRRWLDGQQITLEQAKRRFFPKIGDP